MQPARLGEGELVAGSLKKSNALASILLVSIISAALGVLAGIRPIPVLGAGILVALVSLAVSRPRYATFVYLGLAPLVVGLERGTVVPLIRVNELLLGVLLLAVLARPAAQWMNGRLRTPRLRPLDWAVAALAAFSSITSMLWMAAKGEVISLDDILFALTLWKYAALYTLVRLTVHSVRDVRRAVLVAFSSSSIVASLGVLQILQVGPVTQFLAIFVSDDEPEKIEQLNAKSTIGGSIAFADLMCILVALAFAWIVLMRTNRILVGALGLLFSAAALASGQVSGIIGLAVVAVTAGALLGRLRTLLVGAIPVAAFASIGLRPAIEARLLELDPSTGLPSQWTGETGRLANLQTHIWPRIGEGLNWLFGVRTSARIAAPESYREWIWIESGYTWLVWNGGIPLLVAFIVYTVTVWRTGITLGRVSDPVVRVLAVACMCAMAQLTILMIIDTHLTMRGTADLLFPMVAMLATADQWHRQSQVESRTAISSEPTSRSTPPLTAGPQTMPLKRPGSYAL